MANVTETVAVADILLADDWNLERTITFMQTWVPTSYKITIAYLLVIFAGQKIMQKCAALDNWLMDWTLFFWNLGFSLFSGVAAYKLIPELWGAIRHAGLVGSYCQNLDYYTDAVTGYWGWMFVMSKAPELGDTLFLVARKRPVIFLHWFHHALTFVYAQVTYSETQAWARWSLALNLFVHTVMYFYFAVRALHVKTPKWISKFITTIQIAQFVISVAIFAHLVYIKSTDSVPNCRVSWNVLSLGGLMYLAYLYLFSAFFYRSYVAKKPAVKAKKVE